MKIETAIEIGIPIYDEMPEGWKIIKEATTQPLDYEWISNNKSMFSGERKQALLKVRKENEKSKQLLGRQ